MAATPQGRRYILRSRTRVPHLPPHVRHLAVGPAGTVHVYYRMFRVALAFRRSQDGPDDAPPAVTLCP